MIKCILENGREAYFRHVTTGAFVVNDRNQILLVKRASNLIGGNKYTIPGGFLDHDETTEQGTLRELKEETGYEGKIKILFQIIDNPYRPKEDRQNVEFRYIVEIAGGKPTLNEEVSEIIWLDEKNLPSEEEFAFDHRKSILLFFQYLKDPFKLPIFSHSTEKLQ